MVDFSNEMNLSGVMFRTQESQYQKRKETLMDDMARKTKLLLIPEEDDNREGTNVTVQDSERYKTDVSLKPDEAKDDEKKDIEGARQSSKGADGQRDLAVKQLRNIDVVGQMSGDS